ncbi:hypothetical protein B0O80DRAFT_469621 [Mortierella sp. GBAus27b]|nr:hypothetical protein BGX31_007278 [Mortierella sp. GBA43]KAI8346117.1 hypothetical protein B0O80DRAFT_469621 [Mortierella sp. GBAus27b]
MERTHPLELIEILSLVVSFLPRRDVLRYSLVSKLWHRACVPIIWEAVELSDKRDIDEYRHFIKSVSFDSLPSDVDTLHFPRLRSANVWLYLNREVLQRFILRHPTLTCLSIQGSWTASDEPFWDALLEFQHLRELCVNDKSLFQPPFLDKFWALCPRLETLSIDLFNDLSPSCIPDVTFPRLRELEVTNSGHKELDFFVKLMKQCPNLGSVICHSNYGTASRFITGIAGYFRKRWRHLQHVELRLREITSTQLHGIFKKAPMITAFDASIKDNFDHVHMESFQSHFSCLRHLHIKPPRNNITRLAQEIMSSCPLLETLEAPLVSAQDVVKGRPWVCLKLRILRVGISFEPSTKDSAPLLHLQPLVYERLSKLVNLEELCISRRFKYPSLDLRLECGLDKLSTLRYLDTIIFHSTKQKMSHVEIDWILEHWKNIRTIEGKLHCTYPRMDKDLSARLEEHGCRRSREYRYISFRN